ncbi:MAG: enoyl-CoA hydratase/isomerase family protein [Proteobacteria bacterium]|nr:enoyl-CoA hydratase/isomerase family protein [Pseudomonadota bacterium]
MTDHVIASRSGDTVVLTLHRPDKANAYNSALIEALHRHVEAWHADAHLRAVIITGSGRHFCAGADLTELRARGLTDALTLRSAAVFDALAAVPVPTIAAINGAALGGGLELALACDLRVASAGATLGLPETRLGLVPAAGGLTRLPRIAGDAFAREMIFTGRPIDAATALHRGIVHRVTEHTALEAAHELANEIAAADGLAIRLAKRALDTSVPDQAALAQAILYHREASSRA